MWCSQSSSRPPDQTPAPTCSSEAYRRRIILAQSIQFAGLGRKVMQTLQLQIVGHSIDPPEFVEQAILGRSSWRSAESPVDRAAWHPKGAVGIGGGLTVSVTYQPDAIMVSRLA